jgi:hypothetical protein
MERDLAWSRRRVDRSGCRVNRVERRINRSGCRINWSGCRVNRRGRRINWCGRRVNWDGSRVNRGGSRVNWRGRRINWCRRRVNRRLRRLRSGRVGVVLVNPEGVDSPEGFCEGRRVVPDIVIASRSLGRTRATAPDVTSPVATESGVEDNRLLVEDVLDVTASRQKLCSWYAPSTRVRGVAESICRDGVAREKEDADGIICPLCCVNTTTALVQPSAVTLVRRVLNAAPSVVILPLRFHITVLS